MTQALRQDDVEALRQELLGLLREELDALVREEEEALPWRQIDDLYEFFRGAWKIIEPSKPLVEAWFLKLICREIQQLIEEGWRRRSLKADLIREAGDDTEALQQAVAEHFGDLEPLRLVLAVPPRHSKTSIAKICALAWCWLHSPSEELMAVSAPNLAAKHGPPLRKLVTSTWYRGLAKLAAGARGAQPWTLAKDQNEKTFFKTTEEGLYKGISMGAAITGDGADGMVVDDPVDAKEAFEKTPEQAQQAMERTIVNWRDVMSDRLNDAHCSWAILIMQRLHRSDLAGWWIEHERGARVVCFPTEYDPDHPYLHPNDPRTEPGELLNPVRFDRAKVEEEKARSLFVFHCKHQGLPATREGDYIKRGWFAQTRYEDDPYQIARDADEVWITSDAASKGKADSDFHAIQVWARRGSRYYLLYAWSERVDLLAYLEKMDAVYADWEPYLRQTAGGVLVEDAANGGAYLRMRSGKVHNLTDFSPQRDTPGKGTGAKADRAKYLRAAARAGRIYLPRAAVAPWVERVLDIWCAFPNGANDDELDAASQLVMRWDTEQEDEGSSLVDMLLANSGSSSSSTWGW